ncbi:Phosphoglucomutase [Ignavibacterium album JCM 16511]|uniref:Phosphoglucomutase n=1 Tax=Ignavibacterium album (strain DSM 19864 / JCM 16511 / NBRC 101810 / Mat9-16) TaxID=945713 RepID=I0AIB3_IGNAJ|nr:phosphoglucomutase [Ignavibacterium album]AFH48720.1 Phosphoglucomutase [Ignavibacterium album JCM 16511]
MNIFFGTDGWRGLLDKEVNEQSISIVAQAFADYLNEINNENSVAIGFDGRKNSQLFAKIFAEVLSGNKVKVFLSDRVIPTPVFSFTVKNKSLSAGVMITASHNPPEYNGVKFKASYGGPFLTEETAKVEKLLNKNLIRRNDLITQENFLIDYFNHLEKLIDFELIRTARLNVLIDSMGGAGADYLERILLAHNIPAKTIYQLPDEKFFGRLAEPIEKNLKPLSEELKQGNYSIGVATDGDADRCGVMLDNGSWLSAQETILLLADFCVNIKKYSGNIVKTSSVTDKLKTFFETNQRKVIDVQVGFKYITEVMIKQNIAFGCEESGGFGYGVHIPERDGILSSLFMIEMLAHSGFNKLSEYVHHKRKTFGEIFYDRIDLSYDKPDRNDLLPKLYKKYLDKISEFRVVFVKPFYSSRNVINGLKFFLEGNNRWLLIRSSETEPIVRIYAEGQSIDEVKQFLEFGKNILNK